VSSWLLVVLALAPDPAVPSVGVVWYDEATVAAATKQRLIEGLRARSSGPIEIVPDAITRARAIVAEQIPRAIVEHQAKRMQAIADAEAAYRAGRLAGAFGSVIAVQGELRREPLAPGTTHLLVRTHLLVAQIHRAEGDAAASDAALSAALALDPDGRVSTRRLPPELVERHGALREKLQGERAQWSEPSVFVRDAAAEIEIDGVVGMRPVPPGEHVVVVRRPGAAPVAAMVSTSWNVPLPTIELGPGLPRTRQLADRMCEALALQRIVLARQRGDRIGVQGYECAGGFGPPWFGDRASIADGAATGLGIGVAVAFDDDVALIASARPWPQPRVATGPTPKPDAPPPKKPWYRRAWVWSLVGGVVAAGVVTGAVLGTRREDDGLAVDADSFLRP